MASHDYMDPKDAARLSIAEQHDWLRARRSRRSVLKAGAITAGAAVAAPALGGIASASTSTRATPTVSFNRERVHGASVSPFGRRVSFGADPVSGFYNGPDGKVTESVEWSQVRFTGYEFIAVDVQPPSWSGDTTTLTVRSISEIGTEIDRVVLQRTHETAGHKHKHAK